MRKIIRVFGLMVLIVVACFLCVLFVPTKSAVDYKPVVETPTTTPQPTSTPLPMPTDAPTLLTPTSVIEDINCDDFSTKVEAQDFFNKSGPGDPHHLDRDSDGVVCEGLQQ